MWSTAKLVLCALLPSALANPIQVPLRWKSYPKPPLPVSNSTKSFWIDSPGANPLAKEGSTTLTSSADVCIIGAGISGMAAAYTLSGEAGLSVAVFEARDFCSGATGRNGGHLTTYVFQDFLNLAAKYGVEEAKKGFALENYTSRAIVKIIKDAGLEDIVDLVHGGHTSIFMDEEVEARRVNDYNEAASAGVDVGGISWLSSAEMNKAFGATYPGIQFDAYNLWPLKFVTQLYHLAKRRATSLMLHTNTPVIDILPSSEPNKWDLITPRGPISCKYVIHATNAYAGHLLPSMRGPDGIAPTRGQVIAVKSKNTGISSWTNGQGEYWFPRPAGDTEHPLVILGGGRSVSPSLPSVDDSFVDLDIGRSLRKFLPKVFGVPEREPEMEWTGIMGYTRMGDPFIGPLDVLEEGKTGQYISAGFSGHGMPRAYSCAQATASMIIASMKNTTWEIPDWLPKRYLTENRV